LKTMNECQNRNFKVPATHLISSMKYSFLSALLFIFISLDAIAQTGSISNYSLYNPPQSPREVPLKGNPFLFDSTWAHAEVTTANNKVIRNDSQYYNFNKFNQNLLITEDYRSIYEVDKREFKAVTFYWHDSVYKMEHVYEINKRDFFFELIRDDNHFSLYKFIHTSIHPVSWHTNGLVSEGLLYDQYVDDPVYYVVFPDRSYKVLNKIDKKSILNIFQLDAVYGKVSDYLSDNKQANMRSEDFLCKLAIYLNQ
jgi:hypothetical protein